MPAGTMEEIKSAADGFSLAAYRAKPAGARKGGVVVIQEIFGITDHIREIADFFAANGYEALAPSMYDRTEKNFQADMTPAGFEKGIKAATTTKPDLFVGDMQAAINALGAGPIFITGFCFGGAMSWLASARCTGLKAASGFYGGMIPNLLDQKPQIPIILHFGEKDDHIPLASIDKIRAAAPDVPVYMYDAGHGFCRKASPDYHEPSRDLGLKRTLDFFAKNA